MVLDLSEKQIKVVHLQIWERGSGIDNMRQENFYCILCIILWQHLILRVLKGIWDWMPCTNTMWCPQPKHCNLFTEKNKQQEQQKGTSRVFDIIQTRSSGSQIICHTYDMTAVKSSRYTSRERSRRTSVTIQCKNASTRLLTKVAFIFLIAGGIYHGGSPGAQSREKSRCTSVTIQCLRRNALL